MDNIFLQLLLGMDLLAHFLFRWRDEDKLTPLTSVEYHISKRDELSNFLSDIERLIHESDGRQTHILLKNRDEIKAVKEEIKQLRRENEALATLIRKHFESNSNEDEKE